MSKMKLWIICRQLLNSKFALSEEELQWNSNHLSELSLAKSQI